MIVYGDATHLWRPSAVLARIEHELREVANAGVGASQDRLRTALLLAGQLEQAACDRLPELLPAGAVRAQIAALHSLTARIAEGLLAAWTAQGDPEARGAFDETGILCGMERAAVAAREVEDAPLPLKTAEGPAFYALYPEQYIDAARLWLADHANASGTAAVVGIRSAGTALAAVVSAVLRAAGRQVKTSSTRPFGHPFERQAEIPREDVAGARFGLVVDEGPGLSGSSLASVGEALVRAGLERRDISIFPGHDQPPKRWFSDDVRAFWASVPRYVGAIERVRLGGRPLYEALDDALALHEAKPQAGEVEDFGAGRWRNAVYGAQSEWPAACIAFERPKLRVTRGGRRVLFWFAGLGPAPDDLADASEWAAAKLRQRAALGFGPEPIAVVHGFVGVPWVDARPLTHLDLDPALVHDIGRYIALCAEPRLSATEQRAAVERLEGMMFVNVGEALGQEAVTRARALCERTWRAEVPKSPLAYGDGRLWPHQWLRTLSGRTVKVGGIARHHDHTIVGKQAVHWDLAGACIEWGFDGEHKRALLGAYKAAGGEPVQPDALRFYELAYAAFRAGQVSLCASSTPDGDPEHDRLQRASSFYRAEIERQLFAVR